MSLSQPTTVECHNCGSALDERHDAPPEQRVPCPACGSTQRLVKLYAHDEITFHEDLGLKAKRAGGKKPYLEAKHGEVSSADGVWRERHQVVDREQNRYIKRVIDPDGTVIRDVDGPLDEHRGHGSDKPELRAARAAAKRSRRDPAED